MEHYKKLYLHMFNRYTDLMEEMKVIQQETEELYLDALELEEAAKRDDAEVSSQ